jgi:hypothetical protein
LVSVGEDDPNDPWTDWFNVYSFDHLDNSITQASPSAKVLHLSEDEIDQEKFRLEIKRLKNKDIKKENDTEEEEDDLYTEEELLMFHALH